MKQKLLKLTTILFVSILLFGTQVGFSQVVISDNSGDTPDASSMLEIKSTSGGVLIPRMTTAQRKAIDNGSGSPSEGLLVYDTDYQSFFIYGKTAKGIAGWIDLSSDAGIWIRSNNRVYLSNSEYNVGIGTESPTKKLVIKAANPTDTLLEIQNEKGEPLMVITPQLTKFNIYQTAKGVAGGFAVGRYTGAKAGVLSTSFYTDADSTRVYTGGSTTKGVAGGFAVGRYTGAKGSNGNYMYMVPDNYFIGDQSGDSLQNSTHTGIYNTFFGYKTGLTDTSGTRNVLLGYEAGTNITAGSDNVLLGYRAGHELTEAGNNISIGSDAGFSNINNSDNIFIGRNAGFYHKGTGTPNQANNNIYIGLEAGKGSADAVDTLGRGNNNIYIGNQSGMANTTGELNVFLGYQAGYMNTEGFKNVIIGNEAGYANVNGVQNTFVGQNAGHSNSGGNSNTFIGTSSGLNNSAGHENTYIGQMTGAALISGQRNTFMGYYAGANADGGNHNVFIGVGAGLNHHAGDDNVFLGNGAGGSSGSNTGTSERNVILGAAAGANLGGAIDNVFIGHNAGFGDGAGITGNYNIIIGEGAGISISDGDENVIMGNLAGFSITSGSSNVFVGASCAYSNTSGINNIMIGDSAGYSNTTGIKNISIGHVAGYSNQTSENNICIGDSAGYYNTVENNIFIGTNAGKNATTGRYNVFLGEGAGYSTTDNGANTYIGTLAGANNNENNNVFIGNLSGYESTTARKSVFIGDGAGYYNSDSCNVFIGFAAGAGNTGNHNIFLGRNSYIVGNADSSILLGNNLRPSGNHILMIDNGEDITKPLIYGKFDENQVGINTTNPQGDLHVLGSDVLGRIVVSPDALISADAEICLAEDDDYTYGMSMKYDGGDDRLYFWGKIGTTYYGPHMSIHQSSGDVGIGTGTDQPIGRVEIRDNSGSTSPTLRLVETVADDGARLMFTNFAESNNRWTLYGRADDTNDDSRFHIFNNVSGNVLSISGDGNVGIGNPASFGGGSKALVIRNGDDPTSAVTDAIILYADNLDAELKVMDENSNVTTLSPHNFSLLTKSEPMAWSFYSENRNIGQKINVDMLRAIRLIEELSGEQLVTIVDFKDNIINNKKEKTKSLTQKVEEQQSEIEQLKKQIQELKQLIKNK